MDLSAELNKILDDSGKWVMLRHFTSTKSAYYDEVTKEGVGGPAFEYTDSVILTFASPSSFGMAMTADGLTTAPAGEFPTRSTIYFVKNDVTISEKDIIYELDWIDPDEPTIVYDEDEADDLLEKVTPKKKAEVIKVVSLNSENFQLDYKAVYAEEHHL